MNGNAVSECFIIIRHWATYIEIVEFCFSLKEKLINEQFRIHVKQSSLHTKNTTEKQHKKRRLEESNNQFLSKKEAYNFVIFINVEIMLQMHSSKERQSADVCAARCRHTAIKMQEQNNRHTICIIIWFRSI